ncbi:MAG: S1 RNA-binding domain-containing protein [Chloroflexi bacterium]|nr:S1 RNA-binding domain-containing protein [Chloroflexota bacterium]
MSNDNVIDTPEEEVVVEETVATKNSPAVEETASQTPAVKSIAELKPKMQISGKVLAVKLYGALVDIGVERPALLHISQLSDKKVQNVGDFVKEGQEIRAYVLTRNEAKQRVELSLVKPPALSWDEMMVNDVVNGKVVRVEKFGVFVDIGAERPGLIHVSELANDYVESPGDVVKVGDEVEARIINVDRRKKQVDLSIRALQSRPVVEEQEDDDSMTAMAIALQEALQNSDRQMSRKKANKRNRRDHSSMQDDIIERTLRHSK